MFFYCDILMAVVYFYDVYSCWAIFNLVGFREERKTKRKTIVSNGRIS